MCRNADHPFESNPLRHFAPDFDRLERKRPIAAGRRPQGLIRLTDPAEWVTPAGPPGMNAAGGRPANP